jgi:hypothetical protein
MKKLYLALLVIITAAPALAGDDPVAKVAGIIRQGKVSGLSEMMAESVEISIAGDDNTYSKTQAVGVLNNFFSQNRPLSVTVLHKINSSPKYHFGVLLMSSSKGTYRIALTFRELNGALQLIELRIEPEKVR